MYSVTTPQECLEGIGYIGTGEVVALCEYDNRVRISLNHADWDEIVVATPTIPHAERLHPGSAVLVAGATSEQLFVIGVIGGNESESDELQLGSGTRAVRSVNGSRLQVYSDRDELLFDYDEVNRKTRVHVAEGDLEFVTKRGGISLISSGPIRLTSGSAVEATTPRMTVNAVKSIFIGREFWGQWRRLQLKAGTLNTVVETVVEKAKSVFRNVTDLCQLRAGHMNTVVDGNLHTKAKHVDITAQDNVKIDGQQIHLG